MRSPVSPYQYLLDTVFTSLKMVAPQLKDLWNKLFFSLFTEMASTTTEMLIRSSNVQMFGSNKHKHVFETFYMWEW